MGQSVWVKLAILLRLSPLNFHLHIQLFIVLLLVCLQPLEVSDVIGIEGRSGEVLYFTHALHAGPGLRLDAFLSALEGELRASMRAATRACIAACGQMSADTWVSAFPSTSVQLVDSIVWTQATENVLRKVEAGDRPALRGLFDQTVLRLETMARQLRGCLAALPAGAMSQAGLPYARDAGLDAGLLRGITDGMEAGHAAATGAINTTHMQAASGCAAAAFPPALRAAAAATGLHAASGGQEAPLHKEAPLHAMGSAESCTSGQGISGDGYGVAGYNPPAHTKAAIRGLQQLIASGVCHRQSLEELIADDISCTTDFGWQRHIRHYWDSDNSSVHIGFGLSHFEHGFEYVGAPTDETLATAPVSMPVLLSALSLMKASPVVTLSQGKRQAGCGRQPLQLYACKGLIPKNVIRSKSMQPSGIGSLPALPTWPESPCKGYDQHIMFASASASLPLAFAHKTPCACSWYAWPGCRPGCRSGRSARLLSPAHERGQHHTPAQPVTLLGPGSANQLLGGVGGAGATQPAGAQRNASLDTVRFKGRLCLING